MTHDAPRVRYTVFLRLAVAPIRLQREAALGDTRKPRLPTDPNERGMQHVRMEIPCRPSAAVPIHPLRAAHGGGWTVGTHGPRPMPWRRWIARMAAACALLVPAIGLAATGAERSQDAASAPAAAKKKGAAKKHGKQVGKASYYADRFAGRKMANGERMDPQSNIAASKTLPLGTKARVTNLENGKSEMVEIKDRGPYVDGRIIDLTPRTADKLDMREDGVVAVEVTPVEMAASPTGPAVPGRSKP
jgi:rare lipoprotein A